MDRGILFKTELVRKLSTKTETRRLINPQPHPHVDHPDQRVWEHGPGCWIWEGRTGKKHFSSVMLRHHYGSSGDRLWVREAWTIRPDEDGDAEDVLYRAEFSDEEARAHRWRPGIHLRKDDARIYLRVVSVTPQRLMDINDEGARREGFLNREDFLCAWDYINGAAPPAGSAFNPWVWVIRFELDNRAELSGI
jgi:hypothetical protein